MKVTFHKKTQADASKIIPIKEGFYNPFDDEDLSIETSSNNTGYNDIQSIGIESEGRLAKKDIKGMSNWNDNRKGKIEYKLGRMYAGILFTGNDIVEACPVMEMTDKDLYSKNIRNSVFVLDEDKRLYGLPLGYANCYRKDREAGKPGNISYEYNEDNNTIIFRALRNIKPNEELILATDEGDYGNELKPDQFKYPQGVDTVYRIKVKPI